MHEKWPDKVREVAAWLEQRAAHYHSLGSVDVADGLAAQARRLRDAVGEEMARRLSEANRPAHGYGASSGADWDAE